MKRGVGEDSEELEGRTARWGVLPASSLVFGQSVVATLASVARYSGLLIATSRSREGNFWVRIGDPSKRV